MIFVEILAALIVLPLMLVAAANIIFAPIWLILKVTGKLK